MYSYLGWPLTLALPCPGHDAEPLLRVDDPSGDEQPRRQEGVAASRAVRAGADRNGRPQVVANRLRHRPVVAVMTAISVTVAIWLVALMAFAAAFGAPSCAPPQA